jgi:hypothetical protein
VNCKTVTCHLSRVKVNWTVFNVEAMYFLAKVSWSRFIGQKFAKKTFWKAGPRLVRRRLGLQQYQFYFWNLIPVANSWTQSGRLVHVLDLMRLCIYNNQIASTFFRFQTDKQLWFNLKTTAYFQIQTWLQMLVVPNDRRFWVVAINLSWKKLSDTYSFSF